MQRDPHEYIDGASLYEYARSSSYNLRDPAGRGVVFGELDRDSCLAIKEGNPGLADAYGFVVCLLGKPWICAFDPVEEGDMLPTPNTVPVGKIIKHCAKRHERFHVENDHMEPCVCTVPGYPASHGAAGSGGSGGADANECAAWQDNLYCLLENKSQCGANPICKELIDIFIGEMIQQNERKYGCTFVDPREIR
jgi:hypothetical protein